MVRKSNVLAVMSSKGGVGKTVTTANLAAALATEFNKKVLAIDTNISTASLGMHLNILYPKYTIHDILDKKTKKQNYIHNYNDNLHVIPACIKLRKKDKNIYQFKNNVQKITEQYDRLLNNLSEKYDIVLLDCSPGFDIEAIATMNIAGGLLLISNPEYPSIASAVKTVEYAKLLKMPVGGMILTQVRNKKYELSSDEIEKALKIKIIEKIPYDKKIPQSIAYKTPVVLYYPHSKSSVAYKKLAGSIIGKEYKPNFMVRIKNWAGV